MCRWVVERESCVERGRTKIEVRRVQVGPRLREWRAFGFAKPAEVRAGGRVAGHDRERGSDIKTKTSDATWVLRKRRCWQMHERVVQSRVAEEYVKARAGDGDGPRVLIDRH